MYNYGQAPNSDEFEVTVFGPGYGEAISIHVGDGNWMLIDSCMSPQSKRPASLEYLERIGVDSNQVITIIASHWHDDHVKGLTEIVTHCKSAEFFISNVFNGKEAQAFLAAYGGSAVNAHTGGAKELFSAISIKSAQMVTHRTLLWEDTIQSKRMRAIAFSPTPNACAQALANMAQHLPNAEDPIRHIVELKPNLEAIVVSIDLDGDALLLGSDLEDHGALGWSFIVNDAWCVKCEKASFYKIAHHGSHTGDHEEIWQKLLCNDPISALTPFINGSVHLPTATDKARIKANSRASYTSSDGSKKPQLDAALEKQMGAMAKNIAPINTGFGAVRFRKKIGDTQWKAETFGQGRLLS